MSIRSLSDRDQNKYPTNHCHYGRVPPRPRRRSPGSRRGGAGVEEGRGGAGRIQSSGIRRPNGNENPSNRASYRNNSDNSIHPYDTIGNNNIFWTSSFSCVFPGSWSLDPGTSGARRDVCRPGSGRRSEWTRRDAWR